MRLELPTVAVAASLLTFSACGTGAKSSPPTTNASAATSFDSRVRSICDPTSRAEPTTVDIERTNLRELGDARMHIATRLAALPTPPTLRAGYRRLIVLIRREATLMKRLEKDWLERNDVRVIAIARELRRSNAVSRQARLLGIGECA